MAATVTFTLDGSDLLRRKPISLPKDVKASLERAQDPTRSFRSKPTTYLGDVASSIDAP